MKRAQFAMEYLLLIGFSLLLLLPVVTLLYKEYNVNKQEVHLEHLSEVARELAFQAEKVFYQGPPSRTTLEAYFPPGLELATVSDQQISFKLEEHNLVITQDADVPLQGTLEIFQGPHTITLQASDAGTPQDSTDDYVLITG